MSLKIFLQRFYVCKRKSNFIPNKILNIKVCGGFCRTTIKSMGKLLCSRISSLFLGLFPIPGIVPNNGSDLLSRRVTSIKFLSYNVFENVFLLFFCLSLTYLVTSKLICFLRSCLTLLVAPDE